MPCVLVYLKGQRPLRLFESFQMKMPRPAKKATINPTVTTPAITTLSKNMLASIRVPLSDGAKLTNLRAGKIDRCQWVWRVPGGGHRRQAKA